jgi:hypothetical protein
MAKDMVRLLEKADIQLIDPADARARWLQFRLQHGWLAAAPILSDDTSNLKYEKSAKAGFRTLGLALAPAKTSGSYNVCRYSTPVCASSCVAHAGNGSFPRIKDARTMKTEFLAADPSAFVTLMVSEIDDWVRRHGKVAVRLNTFSDIPWESLCPFLFSRWDDNVTFYDYTKWPVDARPAFDNYDITRSAHERHTDADIKAMLAAGERVAVCVDIKRKDAAPATYLGYPCVDGDKHDARFTEDRATVVLLRPKGKARVNGFARPAEAE